MNRLQTLPLSHPVAQVVDRLEANRTTTPWPLLLFLYSNPGIPDNEAERAALALDSFLMRRGMCRLETKDYNRLFASVLVTLKRSDAMQAGVLLVQTLASQTAPSRVWPGDSDFMSALRDDDLYNTLYRARLRSFLVGIENKLLTTKAEPAVPRSAQSTTLSIEHVLPQEWEKNWPLPSGATGEDVNRREAHVHRLGNLTLTTKNLNSSLSNGPWAKKRHSLQTHSLVRLTTASILAHPGTASGLTHDSWVATWDEERIDLRRMWMILQALQAWPGPPAADDET